MNSLLLDTHVFVWLAENDPSLPVNIRDIIENANNVFVSIVSFWEISIKLKTGKLSLLSDFNEIEADFESTRFQLLPISIKDTIQLYQLPFYHKDPFDRILIAQAINHSLVLVSCDPKFDGYPVQVLRI